MEVAPVGGTGWRLKQAIPWFQVRARFRAGIKGVEIDAVVLQRAPQPLNEDVVQPAATTIHADAAARGLEETGIA